MTSAPSPATDDIEPVSGRGTDPVTLAIFAGAALIAGLAAAVLWRLVVRLPSYELQADGSANVTERALTEFFAGDAWYVVIGVAVGAGLGIATWRRFKTIGWPCAFLAAGLGLVAGLVCWQVGQLFDGAPFDERLAAAQPGDSVPIALALRSPSALAVWAFAAVTPILLGSALGPDEEAVPRSPHLRPRAVPAEAAQDTEMVDERGVVRTEEKAGNP